MCKLLIDFLYFSNSDVFEYYFKNIDNNIQINRTVSDTSVIVTLILQLLSLFTYYTIYHSVTRGWYQYLAGGSVCYHYVAMDTQYIVHYSGGDMFTMCMDPAIKWLILITPLYYNLLDFISLYDIFWLINQIIYVIYIVHNMRH